MRPLTWILPLALVVSPALAQEAPVTEPSFAPLPANSPLTPQWESLDLPESDPADGPVPRDTDVAPAPVPSFFGNHPFFGADPLNEPQPVLDPFALMRQEMERMEALHRQMREEINRQLKPHMLQGQQIHGLTSQGSGLEDRGDHYAIEMEIEGLNCQTPELSLAGDTLRFQCRQTQELNETTPDGNVRCVGRFTNVIRQSWSLPSDADREAIEARVNGAQVAITIPKQRVEDVEVPLVQARP